MSEQIPSRVHQSNSAPVGRAAHGGVSDAVSLETVRLTVSDEARLTRLVEAIGWGLPPGRLHAMLTIGKSVGRMVAGELVASSILFPYGSSLGFLGMVIVHPKFQRQGLGTSVVKECLEWAEHLGVCQIGLLATDAGRPLYESMNFQTVDFMHRYIGKPTPVSPERDYDARIKPFTDNDWTDVLELDGVISGADRANTYKVFVKTVSKSVVIRDSQGQFLGCGMATDLPGLRLIGPLHAKNMEAASALAQHLMAGAPDTVRMDVPAGQAKWMRHLERWGLVDTHVSPLMLTGGKSLPGKREWLYSIMDAALG